MSRDKSEDTPEEKKLAKKLRGDAIEAQPKEALAKILKGAKKKAKAKDEAEGEKD